MMSLFTVIFHGNLTPVTGNSQTGVIKQLLQMSYHQCVRACEEALNCKSAKHIRLSAFCILYDKIYDGVLGPGVMKFIKPNENGDLMINECVKNERCLDSCDEPTSIPGTEILGNMASVGAKVRYRCIDGSDSAISECLSNRTWSIYNLTCNCSEPFRLSSRSIWTYSRKTRINANNETEFVFRVGKNSVVCNAFTRNWTNESACYYACGKK